MRVRLRTEIWQCPTEGIVRLAASAYGAAEVQQVRRYPCSTPGLLFPNAYSLRMLHGISKLFHRYFF